MEDDDEQQVTFEAKLVSPLPSPSTTTTCSLSGEERTVAAEISIAAVSAVNAVLVDENEALKSELQELKEQLRVLQQSKPRLEENSQFPRVADSNNGGGEDRKRPMRLLRGPSKTSPPVSAYGDDEDDDRAEKLKRVDAGLLHRRGAGGTHHFPPHQEDCETGLTELKSCDSEDGLLCGEGASLTTTTRQPQQRLARDVRDLDPTSGSFCSQLSERARWLVGLLVLQSLSSFIISRNEKLLQHHLVIVQFLTMLVGAGGNAGNQASVRVIRGLATGTIHEGNLRSFLFGEFKMGATLSIILALAGYLRAAVFAVPRLETLAITTSLFAIVFLSIVIGALLPLLMAYVKIDPAHSSTTIQVLMDILGVTITVCVSSLVLDSAFRLWIEHSDGLERIN